MNVKAICFDLGGVLVDINHFWAEALEQSGVQALCVPPPTMRIGELAALEAYQDGEIELKTYLQDLRHNFGLESEKDALSLHNSILVGAMDGAHRLVNVLASSSVQLGCLSNTNEAHWNTLRSNSEFEFLVAFQHCLVSHELGFSKPDGRAFAAFETEFGATKDEILFFDDSLVNVAAARKLGWNAHHIHPLSSPMSQIEQVCIEVGILEPVSSCEQH